jgi:hypothetical protein
MNSARTGVLEITARLNPVYQQTFYVGNQRPRESPLDLDFTHNQPVLLAHAIDATPRRGFRAVTSASANRCSVALTEIVDFPGHRRQIGIERKIVLPPRVRLVRDRLPVQRHVQAGDLFSHGDRILSTLATDHQFTSSAPLVSSTLLFVTTAMNHKRILFPRRFHPSWG